MAPKLVLDENKNAVLEDGMPVYEYEDGTKSPLNLDEMLTTHDDRVKNLTEEKDRHYNKFVEADKIVKEFGKITPQDAKKHAATIKKLDGQELVDKHGLEKYQEEWTAEVTQNITEEWQGKEATWGEEKAALTNELKDTESVIFNLAVNNEFAKHPYFAGDERKTVYGPQAAAKIYGDQFKVERNGTKVKVVAVDRDGKPIISKINHGLPAQFHEAVEIIVQSENDGYGIFRSSPGGPGTNSNVGSKGELDPNASPLDKIKAGLQKKMGR